MPTPALLPGLVSLGLGVLRKRKANQAQAILEEHRA
ncbi:PTPA-CTERM sorting domain-containing protein [Phormidesmis priestleyi]|nr:PTPA-CTERM sorting domain-containing protein [Phormidesmis priestleyi]